MNALQADKDVRTATLTYHVVAGKVRAQGPVGPSSAQKVNAQSVRDSVVAGKVSICQATRWGPPTPRPPRT